MSQVIHNNAIDYSDRRGAERDTVSLKTRITWTPDQKAVVKLVDISETGFLIQTSEKFEKLVRIRILLPLAGNMPAEVAWSLGGCTGCRFIYHFHRTDYPNILNAIHKAPPDWLEHQFKS